MMLSNNMRIKKPVRLVKRFSTFELSPLIPETKGISIVNGSLPEICMTKDMLSLETVKHIDHRFHRS